MQNKFAAKIGVIVLIAILLTGCGLESAIDKGKIRGVLTKYEQAVAGMKSTVLADLLDYPALIHIVPVHNKETATNAYDLYFALLSNIEKYKLATRDIAISGNEAIVKTKIEYEVTLADTITIHDAIEECTIKLKKVNGTWKISKISAIGWN